MWLELKNNAMAIDYFRRARNLYKTILDYRGLSDANFNLAEIYFSEQKQDSSEVLCLQSLALMRLWKDTSTVGYNYDLLSRIYLKNDLLKEAKHFANTGITLFEKDRDLNGLLPALIQLGKVYEKLAMPDSAIYSFKKCFVIAKKNGFVKNCHDAADHLYKSYEIFNAKDSVNKYLKICLFYKDTLNNETSQRIANEAITKYDTKRKNSELLQKQQIIEKNQTLILVLLALLLLLLIAIWAIVLNYKQRRKIQLKESELENANAMLQGQDAERERIARELHDRVGSMISTVKLHFTDTEEKMEQIIDQQKLSGKKVLELLDETYEEVRRISHDLDTGLLSRFGFRTAMMQLVQMVEATNKIKIMYIDNNLDAALYQPYETDLYRITQELLSNTIKYAGAKEISVQLSRNNGNLVYSYEDDGNGFEKKDMEMAPGIGYKNIDIRVKKMKGTWHLDTRPGNGMNLIIEIPLDAKN